MVTSAAAAQGGASAVTGWVLMSVAGVVTPVAMGAGVAAAAIVAPPAVSSEATTPPTDGSGTAGSVGGGWGAVVSRSVLDGSDASTDSTADEPGDDTAGEGNGTPGSAPGQSGTLPPGQFGPDNGNGK
ncbi:MAG TPA: hypothetical protein VFW06_05515 [Acidimicrobiia bacterium]|nr:hypothetical protein [Acidimicrobiia bacterium]